MAPSPRSAKPPRKQFNIGIDWHTYDVLCAFKILWRCSSLGKVVSRLTQHEVDAVPKEDRAYFAETVRRQEEDRRRKRPPPKP
jgi:hypothetical protein